MQAASSEGDGAEESSIGLCKYTFADLSQSRWLIMKGHLGFIAGGWYTHGQVTRVELFLCIFNELLL